MIDHAFQCGDFSKLVLSENDLKNDKHLLYKIYGLLRLGYIEKSLELIDGMDTRTLSAPEKKFLYFIKIHIDMIRNKTDQLLDLSPNILPPDILPYAKELELFGLMKSADYQVIIDQQTSLLTTMDRGSHFSGFQLLYIGDALRYTGNLEEAITVYNQLFDLASSLSNEYLHVEALLGQGIICRKQNDILKTQKLYHKAKSITENIDFPYGQQKVLHLMGVLHLSKSEYDKALTLFEESLKIRQSIGSPELVAQSYYLLAMTNHNIGNLTVSEQQLKECLTIREKLGNRRDIADTKGTLAFLYESKGLIDLALTIHQEILPVFTEIGNPIYIASSTYKIGTLYLKMGEYSRALEQFDQTLDTLKSLPDHPYNAKVLVNQGDIYTLQANFDQALNSYSQAMVFFEKMNNPEEQSLVRLKRGRLLTFQGDLASAKKELEIAEISLEEGPNKISVAELYYWMIQTHLMDEALNEAELLLDQLDMISDGLENIYVQIYYHLAKASVLIAQKNLISLADALKILQELVDEEIPDNELTIRLGISYCNLLFFEFKNFGDPSTFNSVEKRLSLILDHSSQQFLNFYTSQILLFKAKLSFVMLDFKTSQRLLLQAQSIANDKGLLLIAVQIAREHDFLLRVATNHQNILQNQVPLMERLQVINLETLHTEPNLSSKQSELNELQNYQAYKIAITDTDGQQLYTFNLSTVVRIGPREISVILSQMDKVNNNSFANNISYTLQLIKTDIYSAMTARFASLNITLFFEGSSYVASEQLENIVEMIRIDKELEELLRISKPTVTLYTSRVLDRYLSKIYDLDTDLEQYGERSDLDFEQHIIKELEDYTEFFHPIRLFIMRVLFRHYRMPRSVIQDIIGINPGTLRSHLERLIAQHYIEKQKEFIDGNPRDVYYLLARGSSMFQQFKAVIEEVMSIN